MSIVNEQYTLATFIKIMRPLLQWDVLLWFILLLFHVMFLCNWRIMLIGQASVNRVKNRIV